MNHRGLLIASIVLAALGGFLYWSNKHKKSEDVDPAKTILTLKQEDITSFTLKWKSGETDMLTKDQFGLWHGTDLKPFNVNPEAVTAMLASSSSLQADHIIEDKATNLAQYGLEPPASAVTVTENNGKTHTLLFGDMIPASTNYYAALQGDSRVFALSNYDKTSLDKNASDLLDKRLLPFDSTRTDTAELISQNKDIVFAQKNSVWQIQKPQSLRADEYQVDHFINDLQGAQIDLTRSVDAGSKASSAFAAGMNYSTIRIIDNSGTHLLEIHKAKDGKYYAKSNAVDGIYEIPANLTEDLNKTIEDYSSKKLFDFGYAAPDEINLHDGPKTYSLVKVKGDWWSNSKKLDEASVELLTGLLRNLTASKFADSGFTTSDIEISVTANDHQHIEKVVISKNGDTYVAKRENDPALYQIDAGVIADLEKAAADVKPADSSAKSSGLGSH